jgi:hypothetical protein
MKGIVHMRLLIAGLLLVGCGGGSSNSTGQIVGTWAYTSGQLQLAYPNPPVQTSLVSGNVTISRSTTSDLLYTTNANGTSCNFIFSGRGSAPALLAGSSCTGTFYNDQTGYPYTITLLPTVWSLQVNGAYMAEDGSGNCTSVEQGVTTPCSFTQTGDLTKI